MARIGRSLVQVDGRRAHRFELRDAVAANAGELAELNAAAWRAAYAQILPAAFLAALDLAAWEERLRRRISDADPSQFTMVAVSGARCLGFVSGGPLRDEPAAADGEVYAIYVAPKHARCGVGSALLGAAEAELVAGGFMQARLRVFTRNQVARRFYERRGWQAEPERAYWQRDGLRRQLTSYAKSLSLA